MPRRSVSNSKSNSPARPTRRQPRSPQRESSPPRRSSPPQRRNEGSGQPKVYVSGLPANIKKEDLQEMFEKCGAVADLFVVNKDNFSFAFVLFEDHTGAEQAINKLNGDKVKGKSIKCEIARPRPPRGENNNRGGPRDGGNRGKGCFKCGQEGHFARECPNAEEGGNNRGGPRRDYNRNDQRNKNQDEGSPKARVNRRKSVSSQGSARKPARKRSVTVSDSSVQKKKQSPVRKRNASPSSSASVKKRPERRSRSDQRRKGKRRSSVSSGSR